MPGPHGGSLKVVGLCAFCEAPTMGSCRLCGRAMCADHTEEGGALCVSCARGRVAE